MRREMERGFEDAFKNMQAKIPKDLVKEYQTAGAGEVQVHIWLFNDCQA
jgi:hypothetical protein